MKVLQVKEKIYELKDFLLFYNFTEKDFKCKAVFKIFRRTVSLRKEYK